MAWPRSPMRTYIANGVPVIAADDLNGLQLWINSFTLNEVTVTGLALDGVGGSANTAEPNFIRFTGTAGGGNPARTAGCLNELRPLNVPKAWCRFRTTNIGGTVIIDGDNIFTVSCVAGSTALVQVQFVDDMADANYCVVANGNDGTAPQNPALMPASDATYHPTTHTFYLLFPSPITFDPPNPGSIVECTFHVFGRQTS